MSVPCHTSCAHCPAGVLVDGQAELCPYIASRSTWEHSVVASRQDAAPAGISDRRTAQKLLSQSSERQLPAGVGHDDSGGAAAWHDGRPDRERLAALRARTRRRASAGRITCRAVRRSIFAACFGVRWRIESRRAFQACRNVEVGPRKTLGDMGAISAETIVEDSRSGAFSRW